MHVRRYAPFLLLGAALLLVVAIAPSLPPSSTLASYAPPDLAGAATSSGSTFTGPDASASADPGTTQGATTANGSTAGGPATTQGNSSTATGAAKPATGGATAGDTSHCVGSLQFAGIHTAPPCQPTFAGSNGGATYAGVSASTIEVVYYRDEDTAAVKTVEQADGIYATPADQQLFLAAAQNYINAHYELYGRKVHIDFFQSSSCSPSPASEDCFRQDADDIVSTYKPFGVIYDRSTNAPFFFDELSKAGVVNLGGWNFSESFSTDRRPYHYDTMADGDTSAELVGDWYCKRLAGQPVKFAGGSLNGKPRKVAILVQNVDLEVAPAQHLASIINGCEAAGAEVLTYDQSGGDSSTQSVTLATKVKQDGITTVIYESDPIAPTTFTSTLTAQNYFPENMIAGTGLLDKDTVAQMYDKTQWAHAFGLSQVGNPAPHAALDDAIVFDAGGQTGLPYVTAGLAWQYLSTLMTGIQQAGPTLNPGTFEKGLLTAPATPNPASVLYPGAKYGAGDYEGVQDYREVYWDPNATSADNGKAGSWVGINGGKRYGVGQAPTGQPTLPNQP